MGLSVGGIDVAQQGLSSEYRILILEMIVEEILNKSPDILTKEDLNEIKEKAFRMLQDKYPKASIQRGKRAHG